MESTIDKPVQKTKTKKFLARTNILSIDLHYVVLAVILLVFLGSASYFALKLQMGIVPDEVTHFTFSKHFSTSFGIPPDDPVTLQYLYYKDQPILYYWINGRALNVLEAVIPSPSKGKELVTLRFIDIIYAFLTLIFCYLLAKEVIPGRWWQLLVVFFLSSTLMFVFLASGVNYDNLVNLFSFSSIYFLVRVLKGRSFYENSIGWLISILLGGLVKFTILPLALVTTLILAWFVWKQRREINFKPVLGWKFYSLSAALLVLIVANFSIYGLNLFRYHALMPACNQVLSEERCSSDPRIIKEETDTLQERLTIQDILLGRYQDPFEWFIYFWYPTMMKKIYGIFGHLSYYPNLIMSFYQVFILGVLFAALRYWKKPSLPITGMLGIGAFYTLVLLVMHYNSELNTGFRHFATQGRYLFPVIGIFYVLCVYTLSNIPNSYLRSGMVIFSLFVFAWGSPLSTLLYTRPTYFPRDNIRADELLGELGDSIVVSQTFVSECRGYIDRVDIRFSTYDRLNTYPIVMKLIDVETNQVVAEVSRSGESIQNYAHNQFPFPPIYGSFNRPYRITITSPGSVHGNAVSIWTSRADMYLQGQAIVNGEPINHDIDFRYQCTQPILSSWFN